MRRAWLALRRVLRLLLTVLIAEIALRLAFEAFPGPINRAFPRTPVGWYLGWSTDGDHRLTSMVTWHPTYGWTTLIGHRTESDTELPVTVNEQGLRARGAVSAYPGTSRVRIETLGDSFTFGSDGADGRIWPDLLPRLLPGTEVVNLGVPGFGFGQMRARYLLEGRTFHPSIVVVEMADGLARRSIEPFYVYVRPMVPAERGLFESPDVPVDSPEALAAKLELQPRLFWLFDLLSSRWQEWRPPTDKMLPRSLALLDRLEKEIRADGAIPVYFWLPQPSDWTRPRPPASELRRTCGTSTAATPVPCVDPTEQFAEAFRSGRNLTHAAHWSDDGHRIAACALARALRPLVPSHAPSPSETAFLQETCR
jgi:hypothetical protein